MRHVSTLLSFALAAAMAGLPGVAMAESSATVPHDQLQQLRGEARQVRSSALYIERLTGENGTTWEQMDRQWNLIKPQQEAMVDRVSALSRATKSMTPAEKQAYQTSKANVAQITADTHQLRAMLDQQRANLQSPRIKSLASQMARDASKVAHGAETPMQTASR